MIPYVPFIVYDPSSPSLSDLLFPEPIEEKEKNNHEKLQQIEDEERRRKYGPYSTP